MTAHQFIMLRWVYQNRPNIDAALLLKQRTFGSLCSNRWVAYDAHDEAFYVTENGIQLLDLFSGGRKMFRSRASNKWSMFVKLPKRNVVKFKRRRRA